MDVRVGLWRKLSAEELMLLNCGVGEDSWESLQPVHSEGDQPWDFFGRNDAKAETRVLWLSCEELTHWKRLWCWEGLQAGGEGDDRGWDGWMASLTQWTWVWVSSRIWWWTGKPGVLQSMESQRVGHNWATELNWVTELMEQLYCLVMLMIKIQPVNAGDARDRVPFLGKEDLLE